MKKDVPIIVLPSFRRSNLVEVEYESFKELGGIDYGTDVMLGLQYDETKSQSERSKLPDESKSIYSRESIEVELKIIKDRMFEFGGKIYFNYYPQYNHFEEI
jgi:replicative DNA helicase